MFKHITYDGRQSQTLEDYNEAFFIMIPKEVSEVKEYECVQVGHHKNVGETIEEYEKEGWRHFAYEAAGTPTFVNHYLLFEREANR